ncbi:MAG: glycoside hydrolase family 65 protein [Lachnospiraceae bacterium]|nr:glycoside hydrolase family 65 protein [Lachnospiraceae bacterium]
MSINKDNWLIKEEGFDKSRIEDNGNRFLLGNGYMGIRGTLSEYVKEQLVAVNLAGIYDKVGDGWREPLNAPNFLYSLHKINDTELNVLSLSPEDHKVVLDFYEGILYRDTVFNVNGVRVHVKSERFPDMENVHLMWEHSEISCDSDSSLTLNSGVDYDVWDINGPHFVRFEKEISADGTVSVKGFTGKDTEFVQVKENSLYILNKKNILATVSDDEKVKKLMHQANVNIKAGETVSLYKVASVYTSKDDDTEPIISADSVNAEIFKEKKAAHTKWWALKWDNSAVKIEGDEEAERALNYSLYHLHSIAPRHKDSMSIPARGLSGQTYKGAVFWDTEMFILDFFLYTEPEVARTLIKYRIDTLKGALDKAKGYGYKGAFYAWESQEGGFDACSDYNVTDVFTKRPMRTFFKDKQVHISSAIVFGLKKYFDVTGDLSLLNEGAFETVIECGIFYTELLVKKVYGDYYEIRDVIGPDEYHERVNNNLYTNRMAKMVFTECLRLIDEIDTVDSDKKSEILEKYNVKALKEIFDDAAKKLYIPKPNEDSVIPQFDGYFDLEDVSVDTVRGRLLDPKEYWGGAYGVASHTQVIKQADVVTCLSLFKDEYSQEVLNKNYDYYEKRTEHGSSLSACMYSLLACYCDRPNEAYPFFMKSASADIKGGGKQWAGLVYIGGSHPASEGGAYMNVLHGFAGINVKDDKLVASPKLPDSIKKLEFKVLFRGKRYLVTVEKEKAEFTPC